MIQLSSDVTARLNHCLQQMITIEKSQMGNIQRFDPIKQELRIIVHQGFKQDFLEHFRVVKAFDTSACGRAIAKGDTVFIDDVNTEKSFIAHRAIAASAGFRAVKSVPIISPTGSYLGVISTHYRDPKPPVILKPPFQLIRELVDALEMTND
jgi:putative methionine-R-sulfoxide reductase with GAF domain